MSVTAATSISAAEACLHFWLLFIKFCCGGDCCVAYCSV